VIRAALLIAATLTTAQQPTIRSTTTLVQVHVVATDGSGNAVRDLQERDFELRDNGKVQPISLFVAERGDGTAKSAAAPEPGHAVIVLDWLNTRYAYQLFARDNAIKLLKNYEPHQKVAIYLLNEDPGMIVPFTDDRDELLEVLSRVELLPDPPAHRPLAEELFQMDLKVRDTASALRRLASDLAHLPGRKAVLWVTAGFPVTVNGSVVRGARPAEYFYGAELMQVLNGLNTGDTAVYAIDSCGLTVKDCRSFDDSMYELARRTGGTVFAARNDLDTGMRMALEDLSVSYTLGFHQPEDAVAGPHALQVKVGRAGIKLRYRETYQVNPVRP
jgi:VWFA-related protein